MTLPMTPPNRPPHPLALYLDRPFRRALLVQPLPQSPAALWEEALDKLRLQLDK